MRLDLPNSCSVEIQTDPFSFTLLRGGKEILSCTSNDGVVISAEASGSGISVVFGSARLTLDVNERAVSVRWQSTRAVANSFPLDGRWYGQGELIHQLWPLNKAMIAESDFNTIDNGPTGLSCTLAPVWLSEHGAVIIARSPLRVSLNAPPGHLPCHNWSLGADQASFKDRPWLDMGQMGDGTLKLSGENLAYDILLGEDIVDAHRKLITRLGHCASVPPEPVIREPIWNTWARYHADIHLERVLAYAREVIEHGYPAGRFVIDDRWQTQYGDLHFDLQRFPDPRGMIDRLHQMGFTVHTWVVPFFAPASLAYQEGAAHRYLVRTKEGDPLPVTWWQGVGGLLDVTNPEALAWFLGNLRRLQAETGLDGFKFDAGEACFLPAGALTFERIDPNEFTHRYIAFVGKHYPWSDVRSAWLNHESPLLFRQWDKASTWGADNGLHSVITGALSLSLSGYPLFLPDMIGGNAYTDQPDAELMIRWAQVNALMPGMQFSLAPWDYGEEASGLCREALRLHEELLPHIMKTIQQAAPDGEPIIRPLFWVSPHDEEALGCDDEFLLGSVLLAAPVIQPGQRQRDIYLPAGNWTDYWSQQQYDGPMWLRGYPAPLERLPLFSRALPEGPAVSVSG